MGHAGDFSWKEVGERIEQARLASGFTRTALAEKARLTQVGLLRIERGDTNPQLETLQQVARAVGKTVRELVSGEPREAPSGVEALLRRLRRVLESNDPIAVKVVRDALDTAEAALGLRRLRADEIFPPELLGGAKVRLGRQRWTPAMRRLVQEQARREPKSPKTSPRLRPGLRRD